MTVVVAVAVAVLVVVVIVVVADVVDVVAVERLGRAMPLP